MGASPEEQRRIAPAVVYRRQRRWLRFVALTAVVLVVLATVGVYAGARRSLPQITGTLSLAGLGAPVTVYRDQWGVPHIEAVSSHDLYMAQGYVTAQDRLWQMDLTRRAAAGRLSEVMGAGLVGADKFLRSLMLRPAAERSVAALAPEGLAALEAYAAGVNAFIDDAIASHRLPPEFTILGYQPEPWTPADSASIGKYMAYDLGGNFKEEVFRYLARQKVGADLFAELMPTYPDDGLTIMKYTGAEQPSQVAAALPPDGSQIDLSGLLAVARFPEPFVGSNNWVVSGKLTKSGKPLLANDPHLGISAPAIWYQTHLVLTRGEEQLNVIGVIFPGAPGIVIGHNEQIAWGVTNTGPDVQDLFIEKRNPNNPYQFEYQGKWEDAQVIDSPIKVKGQPDVPFELVVTRHGPIVSEVLGSKENRPQEALALKWTAHEPTLELQALLKMDRASNWQEFREALRDFLVPTQNFVFAAVDGTIAYHAGGMVPVRAKGDGLLPVPGWDGQHEWTGYIPFDMMPEVVNPAAGFIVTANNKVVDDAYPYFISATWAEPYRAGRIAEVLQSKQALTADDMQALQVDYTDLRARTLLPLLLPVIQKAGLTGAEGDAAALLQHWNYVDAADQGAPLVWNFWWKALNDLLYEPALGADIYAQMGAKGNITAELLTEAAAGREPAWVRQAGGLDRLVLQSFQNAVAEVVKQQGSKSAAWAWGKFHRIGPAHQIGSAVKPLGWLLNAKTYPVGGSQVTVGAMSYGESGMVTSAGPWRQVVDLADPAGNSRDVVTPGQSGHFLSPWYTSQAEMHLGGELHPQLLAPAAYRGGKKLELNP
ncbi:MAG TPA: penicillin acylase family protein [Symbiobacteriaceae bacterium]|nr:penicillin acylase family protein [Symbiobacteriaceae bacterium]